MQHPDEGTVHAWLDGALPADEASALAAHVAGCATCAAAVAEARGLIAASSRILSALDAVPGGVIPAPAERDVTPIAAGTPRRGIRFASARWRAAAAVLVLAGGAWLVAEGTRRDAASERVTTVAADASAPMAAQQQSVAQSMPSSEASSAVPDAEAAGPASAARKQAAVAKPAVPPATPGPATRIAANQPGTGMVGDVSGILRREESASRSDSLASRNMLAAEARVADARSADSAQRREPAAKMLLDESIAARRRLALREAPRIVLDRAYVDSVLAADSVAAVSGRSVASGAGMGAAAYADAAPAPAAAAKSAGAAAPMAQRIAPRGESTIMRAAGCWIVDTTAWVPAARAGRDTSALLPRRIELRAERGLLGDEWNELILRPAPGEPPFPAGTAAIWKPIGRDSYRLTIGEAERWISATITIEGDSLTGRARDYAGERGPIRTAELKGRKAVCRTEP